MRLVVFTADPKLTSTPWWRAVVRHPDVTAILVCHRRLAQDTRSVLRRQGRNIRRHGLIWIPYRIWRLGADGLRRLAMHKAAPTGTPETMPVEWMHVSDLHQAAVLDRVRAFRADLGVSLGAPILRRELFGLPGIGSINLHLGKVPEYRGAPVGFWEMKHGATTIGATVHWIDDRLDTGPVIAASEAPIYDADSLADVQARAGELGARQLAHALAQISAGPVPGVTQSALDAPGNRFPTLRQQAGLALSRLARRARPVAVIRLLAKSVLLLASLYLYRIPRDLLRRVRRRHPVRVFTFHRVTHLCRDGMTVSPTVFDAQVRYIARTHDIVSFVEGIQLIRDGARLSRPAAVLTFDDGYRNVIETARPILQRLGVTACCFVCTDFVGTDRRFAHDRNSLVREYMDLMNWEELRTLTEEGWRVESHTASHARLSTCVGSELERELVDPRVVLRSRLRTEAEVLAYPFGARGDISEEALNRSRDAGYTIVFGNFRGENRTGNQCLLLSRIDIGGGHGSLAWRHLIHGIDLATLRRRSGVAPLRTRVAVEVGA